VFAKHVPLAFCSNHTLFLLRKAWPQFFSLHIYEF
jgi:hypothetical protein